MNSYDFVFQLLSSSERVGTNTAYCMEMHSCLLEMEGGAVIRGERMGAKDPYLKGQVENAETETEVRKRKYGSEKKSRLSVTLFTNVPCRQRATVSKRCESQVLIHWIPVSTNSVV